MIRELWWSIKWKIGQVFRRWRFLNELLGALYYRRLRLASDIELARAAKNSYAFRDKAKISRKLTLRCDDEERSTFKCPELGGLKPTYELMLYLLANGYLVFDSSFDDLVLKKLNKEPIKESWLEASKKARGKPRTKEEIDKALEDFKRLADQLALVPLEERVEGMGFFDTETKETK